MCDNKLAKAPLLWYHRALLGARRRRPLIILRPACPGAVNLKPAPEAASEAALDLSISRFRVTSLAFAALSSSQLRTCPTASAVSLWSGPKPLA